MYEDRTLLYTVNLKVGANDSSYTLESSRETTSNLTADYAFQYELGANSFSSDPDVDLTLQGSGNPSFSFSSGGWTLVGRLVSTSFVFATSGPEIQEGLDFPIMLPAPMTTVATAMRTFSWAWQRIKGDTVYTIQGRFTAAVPMGVTTITQADALSHSYMVYEDRTLLYTVNLKVGANNSSYTLESSRETTSNLTADYAFQYDLGANSFSSDSDVDLTLQGAGNPSFSFSSGGWTLTGRLVSTSFVFATSGPEIQEGLDFPIMLPAPMTTAAPTTGS